MKVFNTTRLTVVGKADPTKSRDGQSTFYRIAVMQNGQATNLSVSEDVYDAIPAGIVEADFRTAYDDKYNSFRCEELIQILTVNGSKPAGDKPAPAPAK